MKNLTFIIYTFLCLSICFSSCGEDEPDTPPDYPEAMEIIVVPGQGFSNLKIGDPGSKVAEVLGEGFERIVNEGSSGNATYNYFNDPMGIDIAFGQYDSPGLDHDTLPIQKFFLFGDFKGMTEEGIKIGSTRAEVIAAYGEPDDMEFGINVYNIGMLISYNDEDKVRNIDILEI